ncbi:unnamed protein product [Prorocentrum cordatum]|uniref:cellulose 1,4-beta-cellobiosidase (non-reducing end) n=1 Tax=Prorocentrum cordatum TaxID=2364126 RepID=A0ABN9TKE8_9DINO|nr:unnamed protein product [Polarella glacialis]
MLDSFWCPECGRVLCESHRHQHTCERLDQQKERNKHISKSFSSSGVTKEQLQAEMAEAEARREAADEERRNAARRRAVEEDSQRQERKGRRLVLAQKARSVEGFLQGVSRDTDANERRGRRATDELLELYTRARRISLTLYNEYEHPSLPGLADEDWEGMKEIYARARELTGMHVMTEDGPLDMRNPWDPPPPPEEGGPADLDGAGGSAAAAAAGRGAVGAAGVAAELDAKGRAPEAALAVVAAPRVQPTGENGGRPWCTAGKYDHRQYLALKLLGKTLRYTVDLSGAGCGCNAAFYLTSMRQNTHVSECSDYYCDANNVCGESCAEIDIQDAEAVWAAGHLGSQTRWHLDSQYPAGHLDGHLARAGHLARDTCGLGGGYGGGDGWDGPRDWGSAEYGKGSRCIDTAKPFEVATSFPVDARGTLAAMEVTLTQAGKNCPLTVFLDQYEGMAELSKTLEEGMTPIVSYWSANDMLWMDGQGQDGSGPCAFDDMGACGKTVRFFNFSLEEIKGGAGAGGAKAASGASAGSRPPPGFTAASGYDNAAAPASPAPAAAPGASSPGSVTVASCPGRFDVPGYGKVAIVPTGWADADGYKPVDVTESGELVAHMDARAYFADTCTAGKYDHEQYLALKLLGKAIRYKVDLSGAGCGCNAAFYLTSMRQNSHKSECSDFYCDANNVCGESCAEIDIQEANQLAWHSTLHTAQDHSGVGGGYGGGDSWDGPRDWGPADYGKGAQCVDTARPFEVLAAFPVDGQGTLAAMEVTLSQEGKTCPLSVRIGSYEGMAELTKALKEGMTPILSYWSANDMLWMDGVGSDGQGPCRVDDMDACGESVRFFDFSVEEIGASGQGVASEAAPKSSTGNRPPAGVTAASGYGDGGSPAPAPAAKKKSGAAKKPISVECPGSFDVPGYGKVELVPTGWADDDFKPVDVSRKGQLVAHMDARAYFADACTAGRYDHRQYLAPNLLGKAIKYTVDLSGAGCGCNAAFYLTSMRQNTKVSTCSDYYCDANNVCGESCAEIDIMEANQFAWHSTLHTAQDHSGIGGGYGGGDSWDGPRDWGSAEFGKGSRCVDTTKPFEVSAAFPVDEQGTLAAMEVTLSQAGKSCPLIVRLGSYEGMAELSEALREGMTPIVSYWSANDMLWMDGKGQDGQGPCGADDMDACGESVVLSNFSIEKVHGRGQSNAAAPAAASGSTSDSSSPAAACSRTQKDDCRNTRCCAEAGMQCYEKHEWWAACKEACVPGSTDPEDTGADRTPWSCKPFGKRAPGAAASSSSSNRSSGDVATSPGSPQGQVLIKVKVAEDLPILSVGAELKLEIGGQRLRAKLLEESSALDGSSLLQRLDSEDAALPLLAAAAEPAPAGALRRAAAPLLLSALLAAAVAVALRRRGAGGAGRHGRAAAWQLMADSELGTPA